jgi:hypothetical protein
MSGKLAPERAIKEAIVEVWGSHPDYSQERIGETVEEWVGVHPDSGPNALLSVYHEVGSAPPEPWNYVQGSGPDNDLNTWKRVSELASRMSGVDMYLESVNPGHSVFYVEEPWPEHLFAPGGPFTRKTNRAELEEIDVSEALSRQAASPAKTDCEDESDCAPKQDCRILASGVGRCEFPHYLAELKALYPPNFLYYQGTRTPRLNKKGKLLDSLRKEKVSTLRARAKKIKGVGPLTGLKKAELVAKIALDEDQYIDPRVTTLKGSKYHSKEGPKAWLARVAPKVQEPHLKTVAMEQLAWAENFAFKGAILARLRKNKRLFRGMGGFSNPSKMPGFALGIPAVRCQTGSVLFNEFHNPAPGKAPRSTVCAFCYALKGKYKEPANERAMQWRFQQLGLVESDKRGPKYWNGEAFIGQVRYDNDLSRPGLQKWSAVMVEALEFVYGTHRYQRRDQALAPTQRYFRWHDSGDIQCEAHLHAIFDVCEATPDLAHWIPTRQYKYVKVVTDNRSVPGNLSIRLSAHTIEEHLPHTKWRTRTGISSSSVDYQNTCPAPTQEGACLGCRMCWNAQVWDVTYYPH